MASGTDYGWDKSSGSLPHSSGVVRIQVTIFPTTVPLRKRVRQHYSYQFNTFTVGQIPSNQMENLETIADEKSGAIGITFKKIDNIEHTVCGIPFINTMIGVSEEPDSQNYINNKPSKPPTYYDRVGGKYYVDDIGDSLYGKNELTKKEHQTFVAAGSLFSPGFMTANDILSYVANESDSLIYSQKLKFYLSIRPEQSTIRLAETFTVSVRDFKQYIKPAKAGIADSSYIGPNPNGASFFEGSNSNPDNDGDWMKQFLGTGGQGNVPDFNIQQFVGYVGVNNVYIGNFYSQMKNAGISPKPIVRGGINFNGKFSDANVKTYSNLPPGVHISFVKALPIFPGEDFTVKFRKLSTDHPIAAVEDEQSGAVRWQMRDSYRFIDSGSFHTDSSSSGVGTSNDNGIITANFGLCPPAYEGKDGKFNTERRIPSVAKNYYLADQPYVIVEVDGGIENRYFLIIPQHGNVVLVEVTSDFEIVDYVDADGKFTKYLDGSRMPHSRLVHNFNISGGALLAMDAFSIHFQHFRGMLQVTFDPMQKSQVVSRKRYGVNIPEKLVPPDGLFVDDPNIKDKLNPEVIPIKLAGSVIVHMGHAKMAFNFSPITYPASSTINLSYPVGITNLEGKDSAVNILLRDAGGFSEDEKGKKKSAQTNNALIKNESGKSVPGQSAPHYSHQANVMYETLSGSLTPVSYTDFSLNQKLCITGPAGSSDPAWGQQYGSLEKPSSIYASYRLTDAKEYVNRIYPYITIESGDMSLSGDSGSYTLKGATRPICSGFSVFVPEGKKAGWTGVGADVTNNVMEFTDTWDRSDRSFLAHSGSLKFYLNKSDALPILENITAVQTEKGKVTGGVRKAERVDSGFLASFGDNTGDQTSLLASLQDKYFYVEVRAWRDPYKTRSYQVGASGDRGNTGPSSVENGFYATYKNNIPDSENTLMFTGLCRKSSYNISESHIEMSCNIEDYWSILDNMTWLNPPFYDAMRDYDAVFDVMQKAGFFYERSNRDPGYLINKLVSTPSDSDYYEIPYDGSKVLANDYVLPGSYNTMNQPILRPTGGQDKYSAILKRFAEISGKVIYFDRRGVMHFDVPPDEMEIMQMTGRSNGRAMYEAPISDIFSHTYSSPMGETIPWWNIVTGSYTFERAVNDIVNEIRIMSSTPEGSLVSAAHMNRASLSDIDLPGFIGFRKTFLQKSGYFGSGAAVRKQLERYTTMFNAPVIAKFSILGRVGLQAGQTILMDGPGYSGAYRLLITNVSNTIKPRENEWLASVAGRYFVPGEKIKFTGSTISLGAGTGG